MASAQESKLKGEKQEKLQTESQAYLWIKNQRAYIHIGTTDVEVKYKEKKCVV